MYWLRFVEVGFSLSRWLCEVFIVKHFCLVWVIPAQFPVIIHEEEGFDGVWFWKVRFDSRREEDLGSLAAHFWVEINGEFEFPGFHQVLACEQGVPDGVVELVEQLSFVENPETFDGVWDLVFFRFFLLVCSHCYGYCVVVHPKFLNEMGYSLWWGQSLGLGQVRPAHS